MSKKLILFIMAMLLTTSLFVLTGCSKNVEESKNELIENN